MTRYMKVSNIFGKLRKHNYVDLWLLFLIFYLFIYSWETQSEREREAVTQAEGEAGSMQGAWHGTRSWNSRIMPWAEGRHSTAEPPGRPYVCVLNRVRTHAVWKEAGTLRFWDMYKGIINEVKMVLRLDFLSRQQTIPKTWNNHW